MVRGVGGGIESLRAGISLHGAAVDLGVPTFTGQQRYIAAACLRG